MCEQMCDDAKSTKLLAADWFIYMYLFIYLFYILLLVFNHVRKEDFFFWNTNILWCRKRKHDGVDSTSVLQEQ